MREPRHSLWEAREDTAGSKDPKSPGTEEPGRESVPRNRGQPCAFPCLSLSAGDWGLQTDLLDSGTKY